MVPMAVSRSCPVVVVDTDLNTDWLFHFIPSMNGQ